MNGALDVAIIGGGPAGLAAGMYLARSGWRSMLFEGSAFGGQALHIGWIENYPGFPRGISGRELMRRFLAQGKRWKLRTKKVAAEWITKGKIGFEVAAGGGDYKARAVISCAGAEFLDLGVAGSKKLRAPGVFHCAFERAPRFKGKRVAVVGAGDTAVHQALLLSRWARRVYLIHRGERLKAIGLLQKRLAARPNIKTIPETVVRRAVKKSGAPRGGLAGIETFNLKTGAAANLPVAALFVLIGKTPRPGIIRGRRPPAGFFSAGDEIPGNFRQIAVAAADGIRAAMECERYLNAGHR